MDWNFKCDNEMVEINCFYGLFNFFAFFSQNSSFYIKNKSFSYQDTPPLSSFLVCILNFDKTSKIFSKSNHLFGRYLGETHFVHKSRAITQLNNKEKQNVIG